MTPRGKPKEAAKVDRKNNLMTLEQWKRCKQMPYGKGHGEQDAARDWNGSARDKTFKPRSRPGHGEGATVYTGAAANEYDRQRVEAGVVRHGKDTRGLAGSWGTRGPREPHKPRSYEDK
jgi:hypothetical protein